MLLSSVGLPVHFVIPAGDSISLIASSIQYKIAQREQLRDNPYSYLMTVEKRFKR